jgi:hypothetical protein
MWLACSGWVSSLEHVRSAVYRIHNRSLTCCNDHINSGHEKKLVHSGTSFCMYVWLFMARSLIGSIMRRSTLTTLWCCTLYMSLYATTTLLQLVRFVVH